MQALFARVPVPVEGASDRMGSMAFGPSSPATRRCRPATRALEGRCCVVALGISTDGVKIPLGLWDGATENKTVARHLLADLVDRGLDVEQGVLAVLDGGKALRAAVNEVLGRVPVQRCIRHTERKRP